VPKYWSKERFSCMITTTCLILWIPLAAALAALARAAVGLAEEAELADEAPTPAAASSAPIASQISDRRIN
jgi:hypothetical protein